MAESKAELWIFAYGSLMWRPDFAFAEAEKAEIAGYRRSLCIWSHIYRGTPERPGLVFGLDAGGSCTGVAFRIPPAEEARTLEAVRLRELVTSVYLERAVSVQLADGRQVVAIVYVADRDHSQYAGGLSFAERLGVVRGAVGDAGSDLDYVRNTRSHLMALGVEDEELDRLCAALDAAQDP